MPAFVLWSAPRSRSTAFLRSMIERGDIVALHEPLETLAYDGPAEFAGTWFESPVELLDWLIDGTSQINVFVKETMNERVLQAVLAHDRSLSELRHSFLIRRPEQIAASFLALEGNLRIEGSGVEALHVLHSAVRRVNGHGPVVLDSDDLVSQPEASMAAYTSAVGLRFIPDALRWEAGHRPEWSKAARWHEDTSNSTGFERPTEPDRHGLESNEDVVHFAVRHRPFYDELRAHRLDIMRPADEETGRHQGGPWRRPVGAGLTGRSSNQK